MSSRKKARLIRQVLRFYSRQEKSDSSSLQKASAFRQLAISRGGLVKDEYRQKIWPILADNLCFNIEEAPFRTRTNSLSSEDFHESTDVDTLKDNSCPETPLADHCNGQLPVDFFKEHLEVPEEEVKCHSEWNQVEMDVFHTLARFPPGINDQQRQVLLNQLTPLIVRILWQNPNYRYYQGKKSKNIEGILFQDK